MARVTRTICVAAVSLATALGLRAAAGGAENDSCRLTSQTMWSSCQAGARSDNWLAFSKCHNRPTDAARRACRQQASADTKDTMATCREQFDARQVACARLGPAPYDPAINPANFVATIDNPYFPLTPGTTFIYEGQTADGLEHSEFAVTHNTRSILGVTCVEVHDTATVAGELIEDTLDWFAEDKDGNVWYFGENSRQLAGGLTVGVEGSWTAGVDSAKPGIVMKAHPAIGDFYRQEFSLDTAEDLAEVISLTESVTVPFGPFSNCLESAETTPLEPSALEHKFYAVNVGNVSTVDIEAGETLELIQITRE